MDLKGKKVAFLGDSITEGWGASSFETQYVECFKKLAGLSEALNYGVAGTRIAEQKVPSDTPSFEESFNQRMTKMEKDVDAVVVFGGTNDYGHGDAPFGKLGDKTVYTFCGACYVLMKSLVEKYPTVPIVVMTPLHRYGEYITVNETGLACRPLCDYVDAIRKTAEMFSLPVLDLYATSGMQPDLSKEQFDYYFVDGLHPNDVGHMKIAKMLNAFFSNFIV